MNREDQNFDQLRRLLRLKRYELPPPRYFNDFSTQVVARLQAVQASGEGENWLHRLWSALELRPVVPAAFGAAICGLLVVGAVYTENAAVPNEILERTSDQVTSKPSMSTTAPSALPPVDAITLASFSTNPVPAGGSLFDLIRPLEIERAGQLFLK